MATKKQISKKRQVEDIMDLAGPVAYVVDQKRKVHQAVCPWCAKDIGQAKHLKTGTTIGELYLWLVELTEKHVLSTDCQNATEMQVQTEKKGAMRQ